MPSEGPDREQLRQEVYDTIDDDEVSLIAKQRRTIEIGREYLAVPNAHIQRRNDNETDEVVVSIGTGSGAFEEGAILDRAATYCRQTIKTDTATALSNAPEQGWSDDPAYETHGLRCYIGTPIFVDGELYGTICFTGTDAHEMAFTAEEKLFVELLAQLLGRAIEETAHQQRIDGLSRSRSRSETKYQALLQLAPDAIFVVTADTGSIETVNEQAASLTGYTESELCGMPILELHPEADRDRYAQLFEGAFDERIQEQFDDGKPLLIERADGTRIPIELGVSRITLEEHTVMVGIARDVSKRRERARDLRIKDQAIEESPVGITIADANDPDTAIMYANPGFEDLTGYSKEQAVGRNCRFLQGEDTDDETVAEIRQAIEAEESIQTEILNYRANGTPFWNELTISPIMGAESREVTHFVGIQKDITARNRRERLIEVLDRVLRHNLRNDMNVVMGFAESIAEQADGETAEMAGKIKQTAAGLISLSNKARGFESGVTDAIQLEARDVRADINAVVDDLRIDYPDTEFDVSAAESLTVMATSQLPLALAELGENAAKYGGSSVQYELTSTDDDQIAIHVWDSGSGLPSVERTVLEAGRETPLEHGSGLGLWMVNWIVTSLGGTVTASVDDGTTVSIYLPAPSPTAAEGQRTKAVSDRST